MKVVVDPMRCEGNAVCVRLCDRVFELGDDDVVRILIERIPAEVRARVDEAVRRCPRQALSLRND